MIFVSMIENVVNPKPGPVIWTFVFAGIAHVPLETEHVVVTSVGIPVGIMTYSMVRVGLKLEPKVKGVDNVNVIWE